MLNSNLIRHLILRQIFLALFLLGARPFLDASTIFYRDAEGQIQQVHFSKIKALVEQGVVHAATIVFDHSLGQSDDLSQWELPMEQTWMRRHLPRHA